MKKDPIQLRMGFLMMFGIALASAVILRAVFIQLHKDPRLEAMAKRQFQSHVLVRPRRGIISDRNGEPLSVNTEVQSLAANPSKIQNRRTLAKLLSHAFDLPYAKMLERFSEKKEFIWIKRHLTEADQNKIQKWHLVDARGDLLPGLWLVRESKRTYPHAELASHILGDVNLDGEGLEGVELWNNEDLRGKVTAVSAIRDALGRPALIDAVAAKQLQEGSPIQLTLDASLQFSVEQELRAAMLKTNAKSGSVIVMNAVNGEILAMANEPTFNPNQKGVPASHRRNRTVTDGYEPGSTLKAILLASALNRGMKLTDQIYGEKGTFTVQGKKISEAEAHEKFEWLSLKKIIQVSSNVGAAKLALKIGPDSFISTLKSFGLGAKSGLGFPGEISGKIPIRKDWQPLTTANIGFGQGLLVTPIQMLRAYAVFANGGWLVQPSLLLPPKKVDPPKRILTQKIADNVLEALKAVTQDDGTGVKAKIDGYEIAGKTGTAQVVDPLTGRYSRSRYFPSFIGFAVGVEPKLVVFASLDDPQGVYYASETAAPLFREVMRAALNRYSIPTTLAQKPATKTQEDKMKWSLAKVTEPESVGVPKLKWEGQNESGVQLWSMPNVKGLTAREAIKAFKDHPIQVEIKGTGLVHAQVPEEGQKISDRGTIRLSLIEP